MMFRPRLPISFWNEAVISIVNFFSPLFQSFTSSFLLGFAFGFASSASAFSFSETITEKIAPTTTFHQQLNGQMAYTLTEKSSTHITIKCFILRLCQQIVLIHLIESDTNISFNCIRGISVQILWKHCNSSVQLQK